MRGRDADEPAPHVLRANDIDAAGSVAAADQPPSREPIAPGAGRASRADKRKSLAGSGASDGVPEGRRHRSPPTALRRRHDECSNHGSPSPLFVSDDTYTTRSLPSLSHACQTCSRARPSGQYGERVPQLTGKRPADHRESHQAVHRHQHLPRRPRGRTTPRGRPRHRPMRGRHRRNAAMARRPRVKTPAAGPEAASAACHHPFRDERPRPPAGLVTDGKRAEPHPSSHRRNHALGASRRPRPSQAVRAGRNGAPRPPRPRLPDRAPVPPGHQWPEPRFRPWPTSSPPAAPCHPPGPQRQRRTRVSALTR